MPAKDAAATAKKAKSAMLPSAIHPPYLQMIKEAITALKDRTGSSQPAIAKFIEDKYKGSLPPNFKKVLSVQLKKFAKSEKLVKVKNSFKITPVVKPNKKHSTAVSTSLAKPKKAMGGKVSSKSAQAGTAGDKKKLTSKAGGVVAKGKQKTKRLSQVSTPKAMKKKKPLTPKKVPRSIKSVSAKKPAAMKRTKRA